MPGNMSRALFSVLLFGTALQGLRALAVIHVAEAEAAVGQSVSLPCVFNDTLDAAIGQIEWRLKPRVKLVVYHVKNGVHYFGGHSLSLEFLNETGDAGELKGSHLRIDDAQVNASGTYVCELVTYPHGSISRETQLSVRDAELTCDKNGALAVSAGGRVSVRCGVRLYPGARYRWTKNERVVSENSSLEVGWMDESRAGVYTLTVSTGHRTLQRTFHLTVLTPTEETSTGGAEFTSQNTNHSSTAYAYVPTPGPTPGPNPRSSTAGPGSPALVSSSVPGARATTERPEPSTAHPTESRNGSFTPRPPAGASATTAGREPHPGGSTGRTDRTVTEAVDHHHNHTASSSSPTTSSTTPTTTTTPTSPTTTTDRETESDAPAGPTRTSAGLSSSSSSRLMTEDRTVDSVETSGSTLSYGWFALIPCLVVLIVLLSLHRRHVIQKRLDRPPPFKPPPPPAKYSSLKPQRTPTNSSWSWEGQPNAQR